MAATQVSAATRRTARANSLARRLGPGRLPGLFLCGAFSRLASGKDDPDRPVVAHIVPRPGQQGADPVSKTNQVVNVDEEPGQPADEAGELKAAGQVRDAGVSSDGGHRPFVEVVEGTPFRATTSSVIQNGPRHVAAALHRGRREHGQL